MTTSPSPTPRASLSRLAGPPALAVAVALAALAPAAAQVKPEAKPGAGAVTVPFELLQSNHMVLKAKVNGKGPYRLVFDVGAPITLLSNRAGEDSGVIAKGAPKSFLFGMRGEAKADRLEVGGLVAEDLPVLVLDHPVLKALAGFLGRPLDGIIGYTFFARYKTTIDYQAKTMTFEPVDAKVRDLMRDLPERMMGPKVAKRRTLAPSGLWGLTLGEPEGGVDSPGVPVSAVAEGSPAAAAGLKPGDVLTTLDGRWTVSIADAFAAAEGAPAGEPVTVIILRDGQPQTLTVTPRTGI